MLAKINGRESSCSRDTGSNIYAISKSKIAESNFLPYSAKCRFFDGFVKVNPVARIHAETPFIAGVLEALVVENPLADFIIGNRGMVSGSPLREWLNDSTTDNDSKEQPRYAYKAPT
ncbi:reverse transcriptase [Plakobranchus ocellatus]|uniref:Reverse transcriptase n=1 Tax=Plakobranchus ocellatus TaxID=259542 RepID=A0AAV3YLK1_9GAST|nr:reverse transcriptase [Plakobranchus ocellatus]